MFAQEDVRELAWAVGRFALTRSKSRQGSYVGNAFAIGLKKKARCLCNALKNDNISVVEKPAKIKERAQGNTVFTYSDSSPFISGNHN